MKVTVPQISNEALWEIESSLSEIPYNGVPIGSALAFYWLKLYMREGNFNLFSLIKDFSLYYYHRHIRLKGSFDLLPDLSSLKGRYLLTSFYPQSHILELVESIVEKLPKDQLVVVGHTSTQYAFPDYVTFIPVNAVQLSPNSSWKSEYIKHAKIWHLKLRDWLEQHKIPLALLGRMQDLLILQAYQIAASHELLCKLQPISVVTEYDRNRFSSALVLAANAQGISTFTMLHGAINLPIGYYPVLAQNIFCWGERHANILQEFGISPARLHVTGCQRLEKVIKADKHEMKKRYGFSSSNYVALFATNNMPPDEKYHVTRMVCEFAAKSLSWNVVVRLHPSEKPSEYNMFIKNYPMVLFTNNSDMTLDESLALADVVLCESSGFGNDALLKGVPVTILDVHRRREGNALELVTAAGCPVCRTSNELSNFLERFEKDVSYRNNLYDQTSLYSQRFCAAFGDEAATNIVNLIRLAG